MQQENGEIRSSHQALEQSPQVLESKIAYTKPLEKIIKVAEYAERANLLS